MTQTFTIDLTGVRTARALHAKLRRELPLPKTYGRNFDALHDVLTEFGAGWHIRFTHAAEAPAPLRAVCADAQSETPGLEITFTVA